MVRAAVIWHTNERAHYIYPVSVKARQNHWNKQAKEVFYKREGSTDDEDDGRKEKVSKSEDIIRGK